MIVKYQTYILQEMFQYTSSIKFSQVLLVNFFGKLDLRSRVVAIINIITGLFTDSFLLLTSIYLKFINSFMKFMLLL
jgi:hypothetical protein